MKKLLFFLLFAPLWAFSQDSSAFKCKLIRETDPYTKATRISTGFIKLDGGSVTIDADQYEVDVFFTVNGTDKCYDNNSMAAVFFEGVKTKLSSRNGGTMNCEGLFHFIFKNTASTPTILSKLMNEKTNHITFTGNDKKETTITVRPENQEKLRQMISCLVNEAKTLIK